MSISIPQKKIQHSIAFQLLTVVFSIYFIVTITVTCFHMVLEYQSAEKEIRRDLNGLHQAFEPILAQMLWELNLEGVQSILSGMRKTPAVLGSQVITIAKRKVESGIVRDENGLTVIRNDKELALLPDYENFLQKLLSEQYPIQYEIDGRKETVGHLILYSSSGVVWKKVQIGFLLILVNACIKTLALWIIFLIVGHRFLTRPLTELTSVTRQLNLDNLEDVNIHIHTFKNNELHVLEESFRAMLAKLVLSRERLISLQRLTQKLMNSTDEHKTLLHVFQECRSQIDAGVSFCVDAKEGHFIEYHEHSTAGRFLEKSKTLETKKHFFPPDTAAVFCLNNIPANHELISHYPDAKNMISGSHFLSARWHENAKFWFVLWREKGTEEFDSSDIEYAKSLMLESHLLSERMRTLSANSRMQLELRTAAAVQKALFPKQMPVIENMEFAKFFASASETGGDWFGFMTQIPGSLYLMIGDVTGHGTPAALVTATASATCHMLEKMYQITKECPQPRFMMEFLNEAVHQSGYPDYLMTYFIARLDLKSGFLSFTNAGHVFPILFRADGTIQHLLNTNPVLGRKSHQLFTENNLYLKSLDRLIFFTDGLVENTNDKGEMYGYSRMMRFLKEKSKNKLDATIDELIKDAYEFYQEFPLDDDITVLACEIKAPFK